jgi:NAD+-processing family protein with receiver domain
MKLWLDDIRPCPDAYLHAHSVNEAIRLLEAHDCDYASLDHDLGDFAGGGGDGFKLVLWMAERDRWPPHGHPRSQRERSRHEADPGRHRSPRAVPAWERNQPRRVAATSLVSGGEHGDRGAGGASVQSGVPATS